MVEHTTPRRYEIVVRGHMSHRLLRPLLDDFVVTYTDGRTRLTGNIVDPSQLHGVLQHLTSLALELDHVNRVDDDALALTDPNSKDTP